MRIGVLSDIHGNKVALIKALEILVNCDMTVCLGDLIGYYPEMNEVCNMVRQREIYTIRGNHEAMFIGALPCVETNWKSYRFDHAEKTISSNNLNWLCSLPSEFRYKIDNKILIFRHASLDDETSYLFEKSEELANVNLNKNEILFVGHTHRRMKAQADNGQVINPGSVGLPRGEMGRGSVAIYDTVADSVDFIDIKIDVSELTSILIAYEWDLTLLNRWKI